MRANTKMGRRWRSRRVRGAVRGKERACHGEGSGWWVVGGGWCGGGIHLTAGGWGTQEPCCDDHSHTTVTLVQPLSHVDPPPPFMNVAPVLSEVHPTSPSAVVRRLRGPPAGQVRQRTTGDKWLSGCVVVVTGVATPRCYGVSVPPTVPALDASLAASSTTSITCLAAPLLRHLRAHSPSSPISCPCSHVPTHL